MTDQEIDFRYELALEAKMDANSQIEEMAKEEGFDSVEEMTEYETGYYDDVMSAQSNK